ncbi:hypothetical protein ZIOFF_014545 [Zingiber officinale]|uniref:dUTPase-like domain-containing protein n=1 Tax=Zingiber officinale TaxID=94328 RepID=A0A8J5LVK7_ZINOF|nr:hypothetical protein ZIOFF_014545 [Zingiber officinale]
MTERASIVHAEVLYHSRDDDEHHRVYIHRNIQLSILTRGYEQWQNGEANLLITRGMVGRLSNTPNVGFAYEIQGIVDYLTSHGVRALPGRHYSTTPLLRLDWVIRECSLQEEEESELIEVFTEKHPGAAGFDLAANITVVIEPRGQALITTGLSLEIPWGTYGRLATRSKEETLIRHLQEDLGLDYAGDTSPGATVLQPIDLALENLIEEDDDFSYIQYLATLFNPKSTIWDEYDDEGDLS